jgi:exopolyphosphatase/guanosine-5'-triphosphate,3'-diphosphate pyrophosphatase
MPFASIDVGSNTIRLLIGKITGNKIIRLRNEMVITRLGAGVSETNLLRSENIEKTVSVLKQYSALISSASGGGVSHIKAVGTSALREARNSDEFIKRVLLETGIRIEIISGQREAELMAKGVLLDMPEKDSSFIIDIGGGSTEWILCEDSLPVKIGTIPVGVVKLFESYVRSDPPSDIDVILLKKEIALVLEKFKREIDHYIKSSTFFIGTAGTITTLASIDLGLEIYDHEKIHMHNITLQRLYDISKKLMGLPLNDRKKIKGLEPERAVDYTRHTLYNLYYGIVWF